MEKTSAPVRWWDWASLGLLFLSLETVASRLVATTWTPFLYLTQTVTYIAFVVGTALGYSRFPRRLAQWLSIIYMLIMLPLQWTLSIDQNTSLEEQLASVGGRLFYSTSDFFARRPVPDPLFFVVIMTLVFWFISSWAAFTLVRQQNYLEAVLPAAIGLLIIQNYDRAASRLWFIAIFSFFVLLLLGRLHFLQNKQAWRERRIFLSPDNSLELTSSMVITAGLIILVSWTIPASVPAWNSAVQTWQRFTRPWRDFTDHMQNAVDALHSSTGGKSGEYFGSELPLGRGLPLSDAIMFKVQAPNVSSDEKPPRYYWRGRSYDTFINGQWYSTGTQREDYSPSVVNPFDVSIQNKTKARFIFSLGSSPFSLLYAPSEPVWVSRAGLTFTQNTDDGGGDIIAWHAYPWLQPGEVYQVDSILNNPDRQQLTDAGTSYPEWIKKKYLQLPQSFSPRIEKLAQDVTADAATPFDKATAITSYLRTHIEYEATIPSIPRNKDALEWVLFDYKKGFCVYYASAEVVMLRSVGVPARMAVGFAQGDQEGSTYTVRRFNAHAWPEVFFPGVGWVEFEPTGNQPVLDRPLPPQDLSTSNAVSRDNTPRNEGQDFAGRDVKDDPGTTAAAAPKPISPLYYIVPLIIVSAVLIFFANQRYPFAEHIPVLVRASFERTGFEVPKWILYWEYWGHLSPIEKAFESINFGLRTLDEPMPVHKTPMERAQKLLSIMPKMSAQIKTLLDEHQTSLYTSREANVLQARSAAFNIRKQVILERLGYLFSGRPLRD